MTRKKNNAPVVAFSSPDYICEDKEPDNCRSWASTGSCVSDHRNMTEKCKLSCAMCAPGRFARLHAL